MGEERGGEKERERGERKKRVKRGENGVERERRKRRRQREKGERGVCVCVSVKVLNLLRLFLSHASSVPLIMLI